MARQAQPASAHECRVGGVRTKLPASLQQLESRQLGTGHVAIFGEKDDCNKFFQRYLAIFVAVDSLSENEIVPAGGYRVLSRLRHDYIGLHRLARASYREIGLSLTNPCGLVETPTLGVLEFTSAATEQNVTLAAFLEPFLTPNALLNIALETDAATSKIPSEHP